MKYKVGQLVMNRRLGLGKVLEVRGDIVSAFFRDQKDNPRTINVAVVPMEIAKEQSDPALDGLEPSRKSKKGWVRKPANKPANKPATKSTAKLASKPAKTTKAR